MLGSVGYASFVYGGIYLGIITCPTSLVNSVQHHTQPGMFCEFCKTLVPLLDISLSSSVILSYPYPIVLEDLYELRTRAWVWVTSLYKCPRELCEFCKTSLPLPEISMSSEMLNSL